MASSSSAGRRGSDDDDETYPVGSIMAKIVGMRHYGVEITSREAVGLVRQLSNPFVRSAIDVYNRLGEKIGRIEKTVAEVLSPLIDSHVLTKVEGIVPKVNSNAIGGLPCQIHLFARLAAFHSVVSTLKGNFDLIHTKRPELALSDRDVDKLFSLEGKVGGKSQIEPMEAPGDVVTSELFEHQKEALGWLVHREESGDMPPFLEERKEGGFENMLTND